MPAMAETRRILTVGVLKIHLPLTIRSSSLRKASSDTAEQIDPLDYQRRVDYGQRKKAPYAHDRDYQSSAESGTRKSGSSSSTRAFQENTGSFINTENRRPCNGLRFTF